MVGTLKFLAGVGGAVVMLVVAVGDKVRFDGVAVGAIDICEEFVVVSWDVGFMVGTLKLLAGVGGAVVILVVAV